MEDYDVLISQTYATGANVLMTKQKELGNQQQWYGESAPVIYQFQHQEIKVHCRN